MKDQFSQGTEDSDSSTVLTALANVLETLIDANKKFMSAPQAVRVTKFQCSYAPDVSIISYLERIRKYAKCSDCCFVMSLIYIDRMIESCNVVLTSLNVHRLLITSIMLSAKFLDDLFYNNAFYAKLGGVSVTELNGLELEFLEKIQFSLYVSPESYNKYLSELQRFASTGTVDTISSVANTCSPLPIINSTGSWSTSSPPPSIIVASEYSPVSVATIAVEKPNATQGTWSYDHHSNIAPFSDHSSVFPIPTPPYVCQPSPSSYMNHQYYQPQNYPSYQSCPPPYESTQQQLYNTNTNHTWQQSRNINKYLFNSYRPSLVVVSSL